jgi:valyl-tRNA synthetase
MGLDNTDTDFDGTEVFTLADKWILSRLSNVVSEVTEALEKFELGLAAGKIYEFTWNEYCDWYIELAKKRLYGEDPNEKRTVQKVLVKVLKDILRALHPFMPFITEEIWRFMPGEKTLLVTDHWPVSEEKWLDEKAESEMASLMDAIRNIRNVRAEMDVIQSRKAKCIVKASDPEIGALLVAQSEYLIALASCSDVVLSDEGNTVPEEAVSAVIHGAELFLPLDDLVDYVKEMDRLTKEKVKLEKEVSRVVQKLANEGFVKKAPAHLIEEEKEKQQKYEEMLETVNNRIAQIEKKL